MFHELIGDSPLPGKTKINADFPCPAKNSAGS